MQHEYATCQMQHVNAFNEDICLNWINQFRLTSQFESIHCLHNEQGL